MLVNGNPLSYERGFFYASYENKPSLIPELGLKKALIVHFIYCPLNSSYISANFFAVYSLMPLSSTSSTYKLSIMSFSF